MSEERAGLRTPAGRHRLTLLTLAHAFATVNYTAVVAMAPALQAALGLSRAEVGLFATVFYGGLLAGSVPLGWVVDRVGVRPALVAGHLVMAVTSLALSRVESFGTAAGCLLVGGFGYAALNPATAKAILGWFPAAQRATAMGIKQTGVPLGGMVAAAAVPLAAAVGWRPVLWIVAGLVTAGGVLCATLAEPRDGGGRRTPGRALGDLVEVLGNRNLAVFNLASAAFTAAQTSFLTYLTLFVGEAMGGGPGLAGLCLATAHAGSIGGRIGWGLVSDRWLGGQRKLALLLIGMLAAALLAGLALVRPGGGGRARPDPGPRARPHRRLPRRAGPGGGRRGRGPAARRGGDRLQHGAHATRGDGGATPLRRARGSDRRLGHRLAGRGRPGGGRDAPARPRRRRAPPRRTRGGRWLTAAPSVPAVVRRGGTLAR